MQIEKFSKQSYETAIRMELMFRSLLIYIVTVMPLFLFIINIWLLIQLAIGLAEMLPNVSTGRFVPALILGAMIDTSIGYQLNTYRKKDVAKNRRFLKQYSNTEIGYIVVSSLVAMTVWGYTVLILVRTSHVVSNDLLIHNIFTLMLGILVDFLVGFNVSWFLEKMKETANEMEEEENKKEEKGEEDEEGKKLHRRVRFPRR